MNARQSEAKSELEHVCRFEAGEIPILGRVCVQLCPDGALAGLWLVDLDDSHRQIPRTAAPLSHKLDEAFRAYVSGDRTSLLDLAVATPTSRFAGLVRDALRAIAYGTVATYGDIARTIGCPRAFRAVGRSCATNPVPLVVPCHRVISAHGKLGGFSIGLDAKRKLLALEGVDLAALL